MRAGKKKRITVKYRHLANYPLDVYYLMDGSFSMSRDKDTLFRLSSELADTIGKITKNFQLGFGMFVDKPLLPYLESLSWPPAYGTCDGCVPPFSFINHLSLSKNITDFKNAVYNAKTSTNADSPEGALDALMQVVVCPEVVRWREEGLRVVMIVTDDDFHVAGDGRLAGITRPNDRSCHLSTGHKYTHLVTHDYPSVAEIKRELDNSNVFTVFAVYNRKVPLYEKLTRQLERSSYSALEEGSENIINILTDEIEDIISTVTLNPVTVLPSGAIEVKVSSKCQNGEIQQGNTCYNMQPGEEAEFFIDIKIRECPEMEYRNSTLKFSLKGYPQHFTVDLNMLCQCQCEREEDQGFISDADQCTRQGDFQCGVCVCHSGFLGEQCQCKEGDVSSPGIDEKHCIQPNVSDAKVCSGQGECVCGICICNLREDPQEVISGHYCQCTNYLNCMGSNGKICSGSGKCKCSQCECNDGWKGLTCGCEDSTAKCQVPGTKEICSGHGHCECNKCKCKDNYRGKYCEDCQNCQEKCDEHKSCIQCKVFVTGCCAGDECEATCSNYNITTIPELTEDRGQLCSSTDDNGCRFLFQFDDSGENEKILVWAQKQLECPNEINIWYVVGGVLGAVVLVGLGLLVLWRCITTAKDRREYAKFILNMDKEKWTTNVSPLYKPATTEIRNPLFEPNT